MKISVIVPVYNVYSYIDKAMESIVGQSLEDMEIIMIDDGSTDGSAKKCKAWSQRDGRIRFYSQDNRGVSVTRNIGINLAKGKYLAFVDPDDWLAPTFLDDLYQTAESENADIAECDICKVDSRTGKTTYTSCYGRIGIPYTKAERIQYGNPQIWKTLTRRSLWLDNNIVFPICHGQHSGIYALLIALANKVVAVQKPLYYYRRFRPGSLTDKPRKYFSDSEIEGVQAFEYLLEGFRRLGLFEQNRIALKKMLVYRCSNYLAGLFHRNSVENYRNKLSGYRRFLQSEFPEVTTVRYAVLGGYNLAKVVMNMNYLHDPQLRFAFSSLISIMNPVSGKLGIEHRNAYRKIMVQRDITSSFWKLIEELRPEYIIMDLIEERFDALRVGSGYVTKSDAWQEADVSTDSEVPVPVQQQKVLWQESCLNFIERIKKFCSLDHIILVETYLSECYGDITARHEYDDVKEIRKINASLKKMYKFFGANAPECRVVEFSDHELYFTDEHFDYGALPEHLNEALNIKMAKRIEKIIDSYRQ